MFNIGKQLFSNDVLIFAYGALLTTNRRVIRPTSEIVLIVGAQRADQIACQICPCDHRSYSATFRQP